MYYYTRADPVGKSTFIKVLFCSLSHMVWIQFPSGIRRLWLCSSLHSLFLSFPAKKPKRSNNTYVADVVLVESAVFLGYQGNTEIIVNQSAWNLRSFFVCRRVP